MSNNNNTRIVFLDGLRGIAILLVILFHTYSRWPNLVPYGNRFAKFPIFAYGWLGVELFFIISGFVIFMTLERCQNFREFILRRWLRLFPAMIVCSVLIFITGPLFYERPSGKVLLYNLIPGLTFVEPSLWSKLLGIKIESLEGVFWSLYVEVKFYIIFGSLFFMTGWRKSLIFLISFFGLFVGTEIINIIIPGLNLHLLNKMLNFLSAEYYGWFVSGALFYKYYHEKRAIHLTTAVIFAMISSLIQGNPLDVWPKLFAAIISILFTFSITHAKVQKLFAGPGLLFIGFISYPLYLLHENIMIAVIIKIGRQIPSQLAFFIPVIPLGFIFSLAWLVAKYFEPWFRNQISLSHFFRSGKQISL